MVKKASRDIPLQELTLRKYEQPHGLEERELVRKFLLSLGLLQPGESRDIIVDIFYLFLKARKQNLSLDPKISSKNWRERRELLHLTLPDRSSD